MMAAAPPGRSIHAMIQIQPTFTGRILGCTAVIVQQGLLRAWAVALPSPPSASPPLRICIEEVPVDGGDPIWPPHPQQRLDLPPISSSLRRTYQFLRKPTGGFTLPSTAIGLRSSRPPPPPKRRGDKPRECGRQSGPHQGSYCPYQMLLSPAFHPLSLSRSRLQPLSHSQVVYGNISCTTSLGWEHSLFKNENGVVGLPMKASRLETDGQYHRSVPS